MSKPSEQIKATLVTARTVCSTLLLTRRISHIILSQFIEKQDTENLQSSEYQPNITT